MSDIGYMLLEKQKQKQGLQNETDSNKISKKEIIAVGTASLIPGSNFQTLTACDLGFITTVSKALYALKARVNFIRKDGSYQISGLDKLYQFIKEGDAYNMKMPEEVDKHLFTCSDVHCRQRRAYPEGDADAMINAFHQSAMQGSLS